VQPPHGLPSQTHCTLNVSVTESVLEKNINADNQSELQQSVQAIHVLGAYSDNVETWYSLLTVLVRLIKWHNCTAFICLITKTFIFLDIRRAIALKWVVAYLHKKYHSLTIPITRASLQIYILIKISGISCT
jgi:hypothetical protein